MWLQQREKMFAARLTKLIEDKAVLQVDLAKHLNVTKTTVSRYCAGRIPDADTLDRMAEYFGVSVDFLLGRTDEPKGRYIQSGTGDRGDGTDANGEGKVTPALDLIHFLRGRDLTDADVEAIKDLLEARRMRRDRDAKQ